MAGLWFGTLKPNFSTFFHPFIKELKKLARLGFIWTKTSGETVTSFVYVVLCTCDSVARCTLQNMKQFNGGYGCAWCLQNGTRVAKGNGSAVVYPFDESAQRRTHSETLEHAQDAHVRDSCVFGIKGLSPLLDLPEFDIVDGFVVDSMHCVDLGVTKYIVSLWLDSVNHAQAWYIGNKSDIINRKLRTIHPPSEITRLPRTLGLKKY